MDLIPSFQVDHTRIVPGIYESRVDTLGSETATTYDIRMKYPNIEPAIQPNAMHTIEHIVATFLRNDPLWKDQVIYWGPMGCMTGCYLIMKGRPAPQTLLPLMLDAFTFCAEYEGEVPGAMPVNCGNAVFHDLNIAKYEAKQYVARLKNKPCFDYPLQERIVTEKGQTFYDA